MIRQRRVYIKINKVYRSYKFKVRFEEIHVRNHVTFGGTD